MKKLCVKGIFCLILPLTLLGSTAHEKRLENLSLAIQKGDLPKLDELLKSNHYSSSEIDLLVVKTEDLMSEAKSWSLAVWIMMILGAIIAFFAVIQALRLARKAPKYNNFVTLISGIVIIVIGLAGAYIGFKGFNKYILYSKAPEMLMRLHAARKRHVAPVSINHLTNGES